MDFEYRHCIPSSSETYMETLTKTMTQYTSTYLLSSLWNLCFGVQNTIPYIPLQDASLRLSHRIKKVAAIRSSRKWTHMQGLGNLLVTSVGGPTKQMLFWKQNILEWSTTDVLGDSWDYPTRLHSTSIQMEGEKRTILVTGTRERNICLWSDNGEILYEEKSAHEDSIIALCSWNSHIASADFSGTLKIWRIHRQGNDVKLSLEASKDMNTKIESILAVQDGDVDKLIVAGTEVTMWETGLKHGRVLEGQSSLFSGLCQFKDWIVAGSLEGTIFLWRLNGTLDKKLSTGESAMLTVQPWGKFLCVGLASKIVLWEPVNNSVTHLSGSQTMTVFQDKLVTCTDKEVLMYEPHMGWEIKRLLWVGNLKETSEDCKFALLPPELVSEVQSFL